jgi:hypothetical protein
VSEPRLDSATLADALRVACDVLAAALAAGDAQRAFSVVRAFRAATLDALRQGVVLADDAPLARYEGLIAQLTRCVDSPWDRLAAQNLDTLRLLEVQEKEPAS